MYSRSYKRYVIGILLIVYVFNFVDRQILALLMEEIKQDLNLSDTQLGFLSGIAFAIFYCTLGLPIAHLADRSKRTNIIAISLAVWSGMTALCGLAVNFLYLLLARIGVGVGEAGCSPSAHSLIADYFSRTERPAAVSIYMLGVPLGILAGFLAGGWVNELYGWRIAFLVVGLPGLLLALVVKLTVREPARGQSEGITLGNGSRPSVRKICVSLGRQRALWHLVAGVTLAAFVGAGVLQWLPSFYIRIHGLSSGELGTWLAFVTGTGGTAGILLGGYLTQRYGASDERMQVRILSVGTAIICPVLMLAILCPDPQLSLLLLLLFNLLYFFYYGPSMSLVQSLADVRQRALTVAIVLFIQNMVGMGLGPQVIGLVSDLLREAFGVYALKMSMLLTSTVAFWAAIHFWLAGRCIRKEIQTNTQKISDSYQKALS